MFFTMAVISIEGNIACGKSTLLQSLRSWDNQESTYRIVEENLSAWQNYPVPGQDHVNMLHKLYSDPARYALVAQLAIQALEFGTRAGHPATMGPVSTIHERSATSSVKIFIPALQYMGHLSPVEAAVCSHVSKCLGVPSPVDLYIYLRADPGTCHSRATDRKRNEEEHRLTKGYVTKLHTLHEEWFEPALRDGNERKIVAGNDGKFMTYIDASSSPSDVLFRCVEVLARFKLFHMHQIVSDVVRSQNPTKARSNNIDFISAVETATLLKSGRDKIPDELLTILHARKQLFSERGMHAEANQMSLIIGKLLDAKTI